MRPFRLCACPCSSVRMMIDVSYWAVMHAGVSQHACAADSVSALRVSCNPAFLRTHLGTVRTRA